MNNQQKQDTAKSKTYKIFVSLLNKIGDQKQDQIDRDKLFEEVILELEDEVSLRYVKDCYEMCFPSSVLQKKVQNYITDGLTKEQIREKLYSENNWSKSTVDSNIVRITNLRDAMKDIGIKPTVYTFENTSKSTAKPSKKDPVLEDAKEKIDSMAFEPEGNWHYNSAEDLYLVYVNHKKRPLQVPGETFRGMKKAYSNMTPGGALTIEEVCRTYGISRKDFVSLKIACGWTKSGDPFTDEEHMAADTGDLVTSLVMEKRRDFERQYRKKEWKLIEEESKRWRELVHVTKKDFDVSVDEINKFLVTTRDISEYVKNSNVEIVSSDKPYTRRDTGKNSLIIPIADIHYGKLFKSGSLNHKDYNKEIADLRLAEAMNIVKEQVRGIDIELESIVYACLGDNFEALLGNMRPGQNFSMDSLGFEQYKKVVDFHVTFIKFLWNLFPDKKIICPFIPGNHDRLTENKSWNSEFILNAILVDRISTEFKDDKYKNISFLVADHVLSLTLENNCNLLLQHGHFAKMQNSKSVQNYIAIHGDKNAKRYLIGQGHLHHFSFESGVNYKFFINPAFCGSDDYAIYNLNEKTPAEFVMFLSTEREDRIIGPFSLE